MKKIILAAIILTIISFGCTKTTPQETGISNDLKPVTISITINGTTSDMVHVK